MLRNDRSAIDGEVKAVSFDSEKPMLGVLGSGRAGGGREGGKESQGERAGTDR